MENNDKKLKEIIELLRKIIIFSYGNDIPQFYGLYDNLYYSFFLYVQNLQ